MLADPFDLCWYDIPVRDLRHGEFFLGSQCPGFGQDVFAYEIMFGNACQYFSGRCTGFYDLEGSKDDICGRISTFLYCKCFELWNGTVSWCIIWNPADCQGGSIADTPVKVIAQDCCGLCRFVHVGIAVIPVFLQLLVMLIELVIRHSSRDESKDQGRTAFVIFLQHIFFRIAFRIRRHLVTAHCKFAVCPVVDYYVEFSGLARIFRNRKIISLASDGSKFLRRFPACG